MKRSAALLIVTSLIAPAWAHDSWISRGALRNAAGEWCCGDNDCFMVPRDKVKLTFGGYVITGTQVTSGAEKNYSETVPFSEAQPSPDGEFWRCKRPDGSRRCFFSPVQGY